MLLESVYCIYMEPRLENGFVEWAAKICQIISANDKQLILLLILYTKRDDLKKTAPKTNSLNVRYGQGFLIVSRIIKKFKKKWFMQLWFCFGDGFCWIWKKKLSSWSGDAWSAISELFGEDYDVETADTTAALHECCQGRCPPLSHQSWLVENWWEQKPPAGKISQEILVCAVNFCDPREGSFLSKPYYITLK